jgi:hypothetical protein
MAPRTTTKRWTPLGALVAVFLLGCSSSGNGTNGGFNSPGTDHTDVTDSGGANSEASGGGSMDGDVGSSSGASTNNPGSGSSGGSDAGHGSSSTARDSGRSEGGGMPATSTTCPAPPSGSPANAVTAWQVLNKTRVAAGAGCMNVVAALVTSAQAYCSYEANNSANASCIAQAHTEVMSCAGYTGADVQTREVAAGYPQALAYTEVATTFGNNPTAAVPNWIDTVFHRIPLLDPWTVDMGYGGATGCDAIDIGRGMSTAATKTIVTYPYDGQTNVPPSWSGLEGPTPPAPTGGFPSSYPINIYAQSLSVTQHLLTKDGDSTPIDHLWLDKNSSQLASGLQGYFYDTAFLYGAPFATNTKYHVKIVGTYSGGTLDEEWSFTTGSTP